jgi:hypothetical protein
MNVLSKGPFGHSAFVRCTDYPTNLLGTYPDYKALKAAIRNYLAGLAKFGGKCTFRELYTRLNIPLNVTWSLHRRLIGEICSEINGEENMYSRPLLGALLCSETDGYITGKGFYGLMDYPEFCEGFTFDKENKYHRAAFFGIHAQKCWLYWLKQRKDEEKKAAETQRHQTNTNV